MEDEEGVFLASLGNAPHPALIRIALKYHDILLQQGNKELAAKVVTEMMALLRPIPQAKPKLQGMALILEDGLFNFLLKIKPYLPVPPRQIVKFNNVSLKMKREIHEKHETMLTQLALVVAGPCLPRKTVNVEVLKDVSGYLMPGTLTLFMGPRGCGKSTLHKMLGGRLNIPGRSGDVTYNGKQVHEVEVRHIAAVVDETDNHLPFLNMLETLEFARNFTSLWQSESYGPELKELLKEALAHHQDPKLGVILHMMGVQSLAFRPAGNNEVPTTTAHERHRLSSAEMLAGGFMVYFFDELNAGGVSDRVTYEMVHSMHLYARVRQLTIAASLVQPAPEVFDLFDRIVLLNEGQVIYQGHRLDAIPYFASIGYEKPPHVEVAEFLNEVATPEGAIYLQPGFAQLDSAGFVGAYESSDLYRHTMRIVEAQYLSEEVFVMASHPLGLRFGTGPRVTSVDPTYGLQHPSKNVTAGVQPGDMVIAVSGRNGELEFVPRASHEDVQARIQESKPARLQLERPFEPPVSAVDDMYRSAYVKGVWWEMKHLAYRNVVHTWRNRFEIYARAFTIILLALFLGTLVLRASHEANTEDIQLRRAIFFTTLMTLTVINIALIPGFLTDRAVYYKQVEAKFFRPFSYWFGTWAGSLPYSVFEAVVWAVFTFFMCGLSLRQGGWHFWVYLYVCIFVNLNAASAVRLFSYFGATFDAANALFGVWLAMMAMFAGNLMPRNRIPPMWIWFYHIDPMQWAFTVLEVNEMSSASYDKKCSAVGAGLSPDQQTLYQSKVFPFCIGYSGPNGAPPGADFTIGQAWQVVSGFRSDQAWIPFGCFMLLVWQVLLNVLTFLAMKYIRHTPPIVEGTDPRQHATHGGKELNVKAHSDRPAEQTKDLLSYGIDPESSSKARILTTMDHVGIVLSWHNITYEVTDYQNHRRIPVLKEVSGWVATGELLAVLGGPGTGKTSLLNILAGVRVNSAEVIGQVLVNGLPRNPASFAHVAAFVDKSDAYFPFATVKESLEFSARLRMGDKYQPKQRLESISQALDVMELRDLENVQIMKLLRHPYGEQMRRVCIATEMAANPSLLFLDDPTAGLESRDCFGIVNCLKNYVLSGRSVITTLHTPSLRTLSRADNALILANGEVVYFGAVGNHCESIKAYFEGIPAAPLIPAVANPAAFVINLVGDGVAQESTNRNYAFEYRVSDLAKHNMTRLNSLESSPFNYGEPLDDFQGYSTPYLTQFLTLVIRFQQQYWRDVNFSFGRLMFAVILGLLFGSLFWQQEIGNQNGTNARSGQIFEYTTLLGIFNAANAIPQVAACLNTFRRERALKSYSVFLFNLAWLLAEIPYLAVMILVFCAISGLMADLAVDSFGQFMLFWFILFEDVLAITMLGMLLAASIPFTPLASTIIPIIISLWIPTGGLVVQRIKIPDYYIWVYWTNPQAWTYNALMSTAFFCDYENIPACAIPPGPPLTTAPPGCPCKLQSDSGMYVWQAVRETRSLDHSRVPIDMAVLALFTIIFYVLFGAALRFLKHNRI